MTHLGMILTKNTPVKKMSAPILSYPSDRVAIPVSSRWGRAMYSHLVGRSKFAHFGSQTIY